MRSFVTKLVMMLAILIVPVVASAQSWTGQFTRGTVTSLTNPVVNGVHVGPYRGQLSGGNLPTVLTTTQFDFWCLDFVGDFGNGNPVTVTRVTSVSDQTLRDNLIRASFLTTLRPLNTDVDSLARITGAIWDVMGANTFSPSATVAATPAQFTADDFYFVSFTGGTYVRDGRQELLVNIPGNPSVVPEPGTYALMSAGLIGLFGVARRRKNVVA